MAKSLFSYVVWELNIRRIVDFNLKPWADRFVTLRAALYGDKNGSTEPEDDTASALDQLKQAMSPRGFRPGVVFPAESAMQCFIAALYYDTTMPEYPWPSNVPQIRRNQAIVGAYQRGETLERIAAAFEISIARVHQIVKHG